MRVAIFDFDGTLYPQETFTLMMNYMKEHPVHSRKYKSFYRALMKPYLAYKMKIYPENKMKAKSMQLYLDTFKGMHQSEIEEYFEDMSRDMNKDLNSKVVERLQKHLIDGDHVLLVSGAFTPMLNEVTRDYAIHNVIGTEIPVRNGIIDTDNGIYHIQGERKNEMIDKALEGLDIDWENSSAYGDSISDITVLEMVGNPVVVRPEARLKAVAEERKWEIIW
ncbi:HAD family phosphatase [Paenisporosarcina quisquiliarum]|uniref:HAD family phosphatase n=1 Tax=Paenisporosarcina quisquiliarum TaxID=365346 RepID=A0A9X3LG69_9BACL|nr:HAD family phosphatase [Paenisporosarcina quisquiliarum]MCZ8537343.1 HAD family phosphatase [Paenisporosarcina quisquiliarum]